jgi:hypothetical protein
MISTLHACLARGRAGLVSLAAVCSALAGAGTAVAQQTPCLTPLAPNEPLCSAAVSDSGWPISHRGPYAQGSSALPAPVAGQVITAEHIDLTGTPITLAVSPAYGDGERAVWGALLGLNGGIIKIDADTFSLVDTYIPADEELDPPTIPLGVSGAYSVADPSFHFVLGRADFVEIYGDSVAGDRSSEIALIKRVFLPPSFFCRDTDLLVGGVMLADGNLAIVTEQAAVGVIPSDEVGMDAANLVSLPSENGADCADLLIPDEDLETVSNSIAADEYGGIYVVSDAAMYKYQWDGASLTQVWRTEYLSDAPFSVLRLGPGSGSTPSLMGTELDDDRFVVITDGQELMHLVLMWRDEIPVDWTPIAPGRDPRIACEIPVTFGDPASTRSLSEQSVLVRGYSAVVVNNLLSDESAAQTPITVLAPALAALEGGNPDVAPFGAERFDWDPTTRSCISVWTNTTVSLPNAIPTMSEATGLMYALGQRDGVWGIEAIDFDTGESVFTAQSAQAACSQTIIDQVAASALGFVLSPVIERLPASCENSLFAATEIGPDGAIYQGTFLGASRFVPDSVVALAARVQSTAGVEQGLDLVSRGLATTGSDIEAARDAIERGQTQLDATLLAIADANTSGELDASSAAGADAAAADALSHFASAESLIDSDVPATDAELADAADDLALALDFLTPCPPMPQADCRTETKGKLLVKQSGGKKNKLLWKWTSSTGIDAGTLPDPTDDAGYALCLYEDLTGVRFAEIVIPADGTKWAQRKKGDGLQYKDKETTAAGVSKVLIKEASTKATAQVKGKGENVPFITLPVTAPVVAQLLNGETGLCWQTTSDGTDLRKNDAVQLSGGSKP